MRIHFHKDNSIADSLLVHRLDLVIVKEFMTGVQSEPLLITVTSCPRLEGVTRLLQENQQLGYDGYRRSSW